MGRSFLASCVLCILRCQRLDIIACECCFQKITGSYLHYQIKYGRDLLIRSCFVKVKRKPPQMRKLWIWMI